MWLPATRTTQTGANPHFLKHEPESPNLPATKLPTHWSTSTQPQLSTAKPYPTDHGFKFRRLASGALTSFTVSSVTKIGISGKFKAIARSCSDNVLVPGCRLLGLRW